MNKLSARLNSIALFVDKGESIADIGTDHAFLPMYLYKNSISERLILTDVKKGPLDIAQKNVNEKIGITDAFDFRLGNGLAPLGENEVDTVIIAGMGGLTIIDIMEKNQIKSKSYNKYIFQPRSSAVELRKWLDQNDFAITDETLAREGDHITEIFTAATDKSNYPEKNKYFCDMDYEISPMLFGKTPLLEEWLNKKIRIEKEIIENIKYKSSSKQEKLSECIIRLEALKELYSRSQRARADKGEKNEC